MLPAAAGGALARSARRTAVNEAMATSIWSGAGGFVVIFWSHSPGAINARITASATQGALTGTITDTSTGATAQNVTITGTVNAVPTPTITVSAQHGDVECA